MYVFLAIDSDGKPIAVYGGQNEKPFDSFDEAMNHLNEIEEKDGRIKYDKVAQKPEIELTLPKLSGELGKFKFELVLFEVGKMKG